MANKKPEKQRQEKYETKVAVKGTLEDMLKASVKNADKVKGKVRSK